MPLIGLVHAATGAEGVIPSSTQSYTPLGNLGSGDAKKGASVTVLTLMLVKEVKIPTEGCSRGYNSVLARGLVRVSRGTRLRLRNREAVAPLGASSMGPWKAQACNCM